MPYLHGHAHNHRRDVVGEEVRSRPLSQQVNKFPGSSGIASSGSSESLT